jgi:hypothetical protein
MNAMELLQHSLDNSFEILGLVTRDLTQEQCDWLPPGIANPIGALYWHTVSGAEEVAGGWLDGPQPLYERAGWRQAVLGTGPDGVDGAEAAQGQVWKARVELPALHEYARAVAMELRRWVGTLSQADLDRVVHTPIGDYTVARALQTFVVWHIDAHCGEISALKGCQGARGYPF